MNFKAIIWDFNGTLLDDRQLCIFIMNQMLAKRQLPPLDKDRYQQLFTFPVQAYYQSLGFDFSQEAFADLATEFIEQYNQLVPTCGLFQETLMLLAQLQAKHIKQFVLSAMEQNALVSQIETLKIRPFFTSIQGLDNHHAISKLELGQQLLQYHGLNPKQTLMIGDTLHDLEVAQALGIECVLVAQGHQSKVRLQDRHHWVLEDLKALSQALLAQTQAVTL